MLRNAQTLLVITHGSDVIEEIHGLQQMIIRSHFIRFLVIRKVVKNNGGSAPQGLIALLGIRA